MPSFNFQQLVTEQQEVSSTIFNPLTHEPFSDDGQAMSAVTPSRKVFRFWVSTSDNVAEDYNIRGFEDVGSGFSYVLPFLLALDVCKSAVVQQPELHLHPAAQCELGDALIAGFNHGCASVVETHSEHMILRILRRIKEARGEEKLPESLGINHEDVRVLYFNPVWEKGNFDEPVGVTRVHEIRIDSYGEFLDPWPRGFFAERDDELFGS